MVVRTVKRWLPVLLCMGIIFFASSVPARQIPLIFPLQDILFHGLIYAVMCIFFARALSKSCPRLNRAKIIYYTVIFGLVYGLTDELHQIFTPGRCASGLDLSVDGMGGFVAGIIYTWQK